MKQERKIPLKDYIAGGAMANAITWIVKDGIVKFSQLI